jgi:hypothetical protein
LFVCLPALDAHEGLQEVLFALFAVFTQHFIIVKETVHVKAREPERVSA